VVAFFIIWGINTFYSLWVYLYGFDAPSFALTMTKVISLESSGIVSFRFCAILREFVFFYSNLFLYFNSLFSIYFKILFLMRRLPEFCRLWLLQQAIANAIYDTVGIIHLRLCTALPHLCSYRVCYLISFIF
jgi:hypothetical protein